MLSSIIGFLCPASSSLSFVPLGDLTILCKILLHLSIETLYSKKGGFTSVDVCGKAAPRGFSSWEGFLLVVATLLYFPPML